MNDENPTAGDSGASITDRLEKFLDAGNAPPPEPKAQAPQEAAPEVTANEASTENPETPESDVPSEVKQPQMTTTDLAKVLGIDEAALDVDTDGNISIKTKIDGKDGAAKFADLLKNYQIQGHAENRARIVAEQEKALQFRAQEVERDFQQRLSHAEQLATVAAQELMGEYQQYDWKALDQHEDQGAVAALKLKFQERQQKIKSAFEGINSHRQQLGQQAEVQKQARLQTERERLPTVIPEWKDQSVAVKESGEIADWMLKRGYPREAVESLHNSTAQDVATFRNAMLFDKLQQSKSVVENKVRLAPKIVKPGQAQTDAAGQAVRNLKQSVTKSGGKNGSLEAYLLATGKA